MAWMVSHSLTVLRASCSATAVYSGAHGHASGDGQGENSSLLDQKNPRFGSVQTPVETLLKSVLTRQVMLYCLLLIPLLWPILGAVGRYLVVPGQCPNCGVAFRAVRGAPPPVKKENERHRCTWDGPTDRYP